MTIAGAITIAVLMTIVVLAIQRRFDRRRERYAWQRLATIDQEQDAVFDPGMVSSLPEPARRFFEFAIRPGTPLATACEIEMHGEIGLGTKAAPRYEPMRAREILAPPYGFIWRVRAGAGALRILGSDGLESGRSWSRFWLLGLVPVARAGGNEDHRRSAFARLVAEGLFWTPAAFLPGDGVSWQALDNDTARLDVRFAGLRQAVDLSVDGEGRPTSVVMQRWSDANPEKSYRLQPFGGQLSDFREFGGYRLPTRVEAGNLYGTDEYFPFFRATVAAVTAAAAGSPCE